MGDTGLVSIKRGWLAIRCRNVGVDNRKCGEEGSETETVEVAFEHAFSHGADAALLGGFRNGGGSAFSTKIASGGSSWGRRRGGPSSGKRSCGVGGPVCEGSSQAKPPQDTNPSFMVLTRGP